MPSTIKETYNFLFPFGEVYEKEIAKLPFHINLIDQLWINENAHSRIFAQVLRYKQNGNFPFLKHFLHNICGFTMDISHPKVEKPDSFGRIDIPIIDDDYVIIIENKVTGMAPEQNTETGGQLARYIDAVRRQFGNSKTIYVVYMTRFPAEPSDEIWINGKGFSYKEEFKNYYKAISYRNDIYPWLQGVTRNADSDNTYLKSALEQYVDYLEGMFGIREIDKPMNKELQKYIKDFFEIDDEHPEEAIELLDKKIKQLDVARERIEELKGEYRKQQIRTDFEKKFEEICAVLPKVVKNIFEEQNPEICNLEIECYVNGNRICAVLEYSIAHDTIGYYYGLKKNNINEESPDCLRKLLIEKQFEFTDPAWHGWKRTSRANGIEDLINLIEQLNTFNRNGN